MFVGLHAGSARVIARCHDPRGDVTAWAIFSCYWPFVWGIHWPPVDSSHKEQVIQGFCVSYVSLNKLLNKRSSRRRFDTSWLFGDINGMTHYQISLSGMNTTTDIEPDRLLMWLIQGSLVGPYVLQTKDCMFLDSLVYLNLQIRKIRIKTVPILTQSVFYLNM